MANRPSIYGRLVQQQLLFNFFRYFFRRRLFRSRSPHRAIDHLDHAPAGFFASDRKGRISVPAPFRAVLERAGSEELVLRPSHRGPCIEAWPIAAFEALASGLDRLDAFSDQADDLAAALFADAHGARADNEGRLVLPEAMIAYAALSDAIACVGVGRIFQIWEPEAARRRTEEARLRARERGLTLPAASGRAP